MNFPEVNVEKEVSALGKLLRNPTQGVPAIVFTDYSCVDVKEVIRRGVERVRPASETGEELRDVILWLIILHYAKQSKADVAFVSNDKTFTDSDGRLHPSLQTDMERAGVAIAFYCSVADFVKGNALDEEILDYKNFATHVSTDELQGISTEQLLGSRYRDGTIVGAEVLRCEFAEGRRYRVAEDSYYVEARFTGEGLISLRKIAPLYIQANLAGAPTVWNVTTGAMPWIAGTNLFAGLPPYNQVAGISALSEFTRVVTPDATPKSETSYKCSFSIGLSMRVRAGIRESLEVDQLILLGELTPIAASGE